MDSELTAVRIWDLPTRVFHWGLAGCVVASVFSAKIGGSAMLWHFRFGYVVFALLGFRILWGLVGGRWSRFISFVHAPATTLRYLRGQTHAHQHLDAGHSPLGALSVFGLIVILALQVGSGLFADDEIANTGPLVKFVTDATSALFTRWHRSFGQWLILALVALHVAAILFYLLKKKHNLVRPMITGDKPLPVNVPASADTTGSRLFAAVLMALCAGAVAWLVSLGA